MLEDDHSNNADSDQFVSKWDKCQFDPIIHMLVKELVLITILWPFALLGIDIIDPLPTTPT